MTKEEIVKEHFTDDEVIVWEGVADKLSLFSRRDIVLTPLSCIVGGYLLFYAYATFMQMLAGANVAFALSGITTLLLGLYFVFGRIPYRYKRYSRNIYFVTNKRVLVFNTLRDIITTDLLLSEIQPEIFGHDIFFGTKNLAGDIIHGLGLDIFFKNAQETPAFYAIQNPEDVKKAIKKAKKHRKAASVNDNSDDFI